MSDPITCQVCRQPLTLQAMTSDGEAWSCECQRTTLTRHNRGNLDLAVQRPHAYPSHGEPHDPKLDWPERYTDGPSGGTHGANSGSRG